MKFILSIILIISTVCSLFAQGNTLAVSGNGVTDYVFTDYTQGFIFVVEGGRVVWQHEAPLSNDLWVLENGNLLFTTGNGVLELTRSKDTVFCYKSDCHIFACQRLDNGNTFIGECESGRLLEVAPEGKIVNELCILPNGATSAGKSFMRNARRLGNGNYLVAHYGPKKVSEYAPDGREVWSVPVSGGAHSVIRLPDGNTLVSSADADKNPQIIEFAPDSSIVWKLSNDDLPGAPLRFLGGMQYVEGVGIFFANWQGHGVKELQPHIFLVNRNKQIVWSLLPNASIQTVSSILVPQFKPIIH